MKYEKVGDYFIPKISVPKSKYKNVNLSKYGRAYLKYLKENKRENKLIDEVYEQDLRAQNMEKSIIEDMKKKQNITEKLKEKDQMKWVGLMNNIKNSAVEIVMNDLIK